MSEFAQLRICTITINVNVCQTFWNGSHVIPLQKQGLILPTKILRSKLFFRLNLKILKPQIFLEKSEKNQI